MNYNIFVLNKFDYYRLVIQLYLNISRGDLSSAQPQLSSTDLKKDASFALKNTFLWGRDHLCGGLFSQMFRLPERKKK